MYAKFLQNLLRLILYFYFHFFFFFFFLGGGGGGGEGVFMFCFVLFFFFVFFFFDFCLGRGGSFTPHNFFERCIEALWSNSLFATQCRLRTKHDRLMHFSSLIKAISKNLKNYELQLVFFYHFYNP